MKGLRVRGHAFKPQRTYNTFFGRRQQVWLAGCKCLWTSKEPRRSRLAALQDYHAHLDDTLSFSPARRAYPALTQEVAS